MQIKMIKVLLYKNKKQLENPHPILYTMDNGIKV